MAVSSLTAHRDPLMFGFERGSSIGGIARDFVLVFLHFGACQSLLVGIPEAIGLHPILYCFGIGSSVRNLKKELYSFS